ncbi:MAG: hypothetical protein ACTSX8_07965 [Alphaproteobacteria bacterium]
MNRKLWSLVRMLSGGEETMRLMVMKIHEEDGTGDPLRGTEEFTSTRKLTMNQFERLVGMVEGEAGPLPRRRSNGENVSFIATKQQRAYVHHMANCLGWSAAALKSFIERQAGEAGMKTHRKASSVITPMERLMREHGYVCSETDGKKWWEPADVDPFAAFDEELPF